jgi:class 3 adenylate cyclase
MGGSVVVSRSLALTSAPADVWPLITDTDRTNRLVFGQSNVYEAIDGGERTSARFRVTTKVLGMPLVYEEAPFEWTLHKSFSVVRRMSAGPLLSYSYGITLEPTSSGGTQVTIRLELVPRHWLFRPLLVAVGERIVRDMSRLGESIDTHLRDKSPSPFTKPASPANDERLDHASRELGKRGLDPKVVRTVIELLRSAPDADLVRIRPFELAREHGHDGRETLRALLHSVTVGVAELRWALVCPSCRTANDQVTSLSEVGDAGHCQLCDLSYGIELDKAVEATFVPHPSIRQVTNQMFCVGGPWRTPHVVVQAVIDPGATRSLEAPPEPGRYRLFARGGAMASIEVGSDAPKSARASLSNGSFDRPDLSVAPGGELAVANATAEPLHVKIERLAYATLAATAHYVTTLSEFRRFFSKDLLKPGTPLKVASCAILFSDLTGSTALYTTVGDAAAFRLVDDHFDVLRKAIDEHGGTVVKTMGDAIMAAFTEPLACVRASIACLYAFEKFRVDADNGELTSIKLGLYAGPCYVLTANDAIDYFGQTVNCASRVQHCAGPGEIVLEEDVYARLGDKERARLRLVERFETRVKGVEHPLRLVRTTLAEQVTSERRHAGKPLPSDGAQVRHSR